jgi:hypothetical protein
MLLQPLAHSGDRIGAPTAAARESGHTFLGSLIASACREEVPVGSSRCRISPISAALSKAARVLAARAFSKSARSAGPTPKAADLFSPCAITAASAFRVLLSLRYLPMIQGRSHCEQLLESQRSARYTPFPRRRSLSTTQDLSPATLPRQVQPSGEALLLALAMYPTCYHQTRAFLVAGYVIILTRKYLSDTGDGMVL